MSNASSTKVTKLSTEDEAEALFGIGSIFVEAQINDNAAIGLDYVPHGLDRNNRKRSSHWCLPRIKRN